jgi:hypothetical protein
MLVRYTEGRSWSRVLHAFSLELSSGACCGSRLGQVCVQNDHQIADLHDSDLDLRGVLVWYLQ